MKSPEYDWIVVGAGAAGIAIAEMLSRLGLSVLILEKNSTLAAETTRIFHEWLHTGTLYTLVPDKLKTTRYLLGAIDDLFEYYSTYGLMNLVAQEHGLCVKDKGWFNDQHIFYKYRVRPFNPLWNLAVARSRWLIDEINTHDWLRRRAGGIHDGFRFDMFNIIKNYPLQHTGTIDVQSPDVTINSRVLLSDLLYSYEHAAGQMIVNCTVDKIIDHGQCVEVRSNSGVFFGKHAVICAADGISRFTDSKVKVSYAPMFVVDGLAENAQSFVELDYVTKSCINLLNKGHGYGLAGGISVQREDHVKPYFDYCVALHKQRNPDIRVLDMYVGLKKELVGKGQERNYLYHIHNVSENVWGVVLGKFSLSFSLAPEFIRRVYHKNPPRSVTRPQNALSLIHPLLSNPHWQDVVLNKEK